MQIFATQNLFRREVTERKGWVKEFQARKIFQESFIVYKIVARALGDEGALQRALFWEIGLRQKLPESIRKNAANNVEIDEKDYSPADIAEDIAAPVSTGEHKRPRGSGGKPRRRRGRRGGANRGGANNGNAPQSGGE